MAITTHGAATTASLPNGGGIRDIIYNYFQDEANREVQNYVLSAQVRKQADTIHLFIYSTIAIIFILFTVVRIAIDNHKSKRRLQLQLQQIQEVQEERSQAVKQAIESAESAFFVSHEYETLQRRIATGQRLKDEEWQSIESHIKKVYPGFISQLRNLYPMSELEFQEMCKQFANHLQNRCKHKSLTNLQKAFTFAS